MTDWEHKPAPGPGGSILGGALCLIGGGVGLAFVVPGSGWDAFAWVCAGVAFLGAVLLTFGGTALFRARHGSRSDHA